jgi:ribosome biogenesis protein ENP2
LPAAASATAAAAHIVLASATMSMKVSAPDGVKVRMSSQSPCKSELTASISWCLQVYNISSSKTLPQWLSESKKKSLRKNEEYRRRLELLQDFRFQAACQRLKVSPDQQFIFATGYHPPQVGAGVHTAPLNCGHQLRAGLHTFATIATTQVKVYDLANLSLKFERHLDAEIIDFQVCT